MALNVMVPTHLKDSLEQKCKRDDLSMAQGVRRALAMYLQVSEDSGNV